jgi:hypothetical protein
MFKMVAFAGVFGLTAMFAGSAKAQISAVPPDGAKVTMKYSGWNPGTPSMTLKKEEVSKNGKDWIYTIQVTGQNQYLMAKDSQEGTTVGLSKPDEKVTPTKWILHKHGNPFQIMHADNGANAISVNKDKNGLVLRRNQGDELQRILIQEIYEGLAGSYKEKSGGEMEIRKADDAKKEATPWRFVLKGEGDWACAEGQDNPGNGKPSVFFIKFAEGPFKGEQYNIVRDKDGKMKELQLVGGSKAIWVKQ